MTKHLLIGGLVAVGFDPRGAYLLAVSHSGRGVYCSRTWERLARDAAPSYPENGYCWGIGPIEGLLVKVRILDSEHPIKVTSPDGKTLVYCESSGVRVEID